MKRNLFLRTDVLPEEIPLMFSNKNIYLPYTENKMKEYIKIENLVNLDNTIPYYFHIPKNEGEERKLSLLHPLAQLQAFSYILKYEQLITSFCSKSFFSVRSPIKRNSAKYNDNTGLKKKLERLNEEFSFSKTTNTTSDEDEIMFLNYFSYRKYKNISQLYNSAKFNRSKYKYDYYTKFDIQKFFPSVYSHSLAWAIFGEKSIAKQHKSASHDNLFANATDRVAQKINFNETHGLVIGPEFSRVISELLLTKVDVDLFIELELEEKILNKDYTIYRYVDDYFVFSKDSNTTKIIESKLKNLLENYNLHLNMNKKELQTKPFKTFSSPIIELKSILKEFDVDKLFIRLSLEKNGLINDSVTKDNLFIKGKRVHWNNMFSKIEKLIYENKSSSRKIVNYFLKSIRDSIDYDGSKPWVTVNSLEIITNIYSLNINYESTNYLIAICGKLNRKSNQLLEIQRKLILDLDTLVDDYLKKKEHIETIINNIETVKESLFHNLYSTIKNNFDKMEYMYNILIFFKTLDKPLNAQFLSKVIKNYPSSYFILCSTAYYIQNENLDGLNKNYLTVIQLMEKTIDDIKNNYKNKGTGNNLLESEYFYIINDFSFYPGFQEKKRRQYRKKIETDYLKLIQTRTNNITENKEMTIVWDLITKRSYFEWNKSTDDFVRKVAKKSSNIFRSTDESTY